MRRDATVLRRVGVHRKRTWMLKACRQTDTTAVVLITTPCQDLKDTATLENLLVEAPS